MSPGADTTTPDHTEQLPAMARLREVIEVDEREFGPVGKDGLRRAEAEWNGAPTARATL